MPTVIIRPTTLWQETTISEPDHASFWSALNRYWAETLAEMEEYHNATGLPHRPLEKLIYASQCIGLFDNYSLLLPESESCPMIFDSWNCWKPTRRNHTQEMPCPNFPDLGFSPSRSAYKYCTESGDWWRHPETNMTWSNYTNCVDLQEFMFHKTINIVTMSGLGLSLFALLASLFIFFRFKSLNCGRTKMHKNLFAALALNNVCWIVWYTSVPYQPQVLNENPVWCRVLDIVKNYFMLSTYTWMLGEGSYLQLLLINTWRVKKWQVWTIVISCWTMPLVSLVPYTYTRLQEEDVNCWMDTGNSIWCLGALVVVVMVVNLVFVINVIRVIKRKRVLQAAVAATEERAASLNNQNGRASVNQQPGSHVSHHSGTASTMKAARAALMLVPILGLHFMLLPMRPEEGTPLLKVYQVVSAVTSSFQGFMVSLLFCFLNSDVLDIFRKKFSRIKVRLQESDWRRQSQNVSFAAAGASSNAKANSSKNRSNSCSVANRSLVTNITVLEPVSRVRSAREHDEDELEEVALMSVNKVANDNDESRL